jgi:hypothetical protein
MESEFKLVITEKLEKIYPIFAILIFLNFVFNLGEFQVSFLWKISLMGLFLLILGKYIFVISGALIIGFCVLTILTVLSIIATMVALVGLKQYWLKILEEMNTIKDLTHELYSKKYP